MTKEDLDKLASDLDTSEIRYLIDKKIENNAIEHQLLIEKQLPPTAQIVSDYSTKGYVQYQVEPTNGYKLVFRSLTPWQNDEAVKYAKANADNDAGMFQRLQARYRLAMGLVSVNGHNYANQTMPDQPYHMAASPQELKKALKEAADAKVAILDMDGMSDSLVSYQGTFELVVYNRVNGFKDVSEAIKNSTATREKNA